MLNMEQELTNALINAKIAGAAEVIDPLVLALQDLPADGLLSVGAILREISRAKDKYELALRRKMV